MWIEFDYNSNEDAVYMKLGERPYEFKPASSFLHTFLAPANIFGIEFIQVLKNNRQQDIKQVIAEAEKIIKEAGERDIKDV